ncbi:MAG TPA: hypothetical protein VFQ40_07335, partial [Actinomycetota bacterium]|nr:hypothetical protein [Actinomycetota bacterium]
MRRPPLLRPASLLLTGLALLLSAQQQPSAAARPLARVLPAPRPAAELVRAAGPWVADLDEVVGGRHVSVAVGVDGRWLYRHGARTPRPPASNEKLLLSMALLDRVRLTTTIRTKVFASGPRSGSELDGRL